MKQRGLILTIVLVVFAAFAAMAASGTPSDHLIPFTLVSVTFAVNFVARPGSVRHAKLEAVSGSNRHIRLDLSFEHLNDSEPKSVQKSVDEPDGLRTSTYWSADRDVLKKGILLVHTSPGHPSYPLAENNCVASARQQWVRLETLTIDGQQFQTSVISDVSKSGATTEWRALLPGLGCLILKRVYSHTDEGGGKTVTEPRSLVIGEPDATLFTKFDADAAASEDAGTLQAFEAANINGPH